MNWCRLHILPLHIFHITCSYIHFVKLCAVQSIRGFLIVTKKENLLYYLYIEKYFLLNVYTFLPVYHLLFHTLVSGYRLWSVWAQTFKEPLWQWRAPFWQIALSSLQTVKFCFTAYSPDGLITHPETYGPFTRSWISSVRFTNFTQHMNN